MPDRLWIDDEAGRLIQERKEPRESFEGHSLTTPWDKLHELYFVSYALWNYFVTPFVFREPGFALLLRPSEFRWSPCSDFAAGGVSGW